MDECWRRLMRRCDAHRGEPGIGKSTLLCSSARASRRKGDSLRVAGIASSDQDEGRTPWRIARHYRSLLLGDLGLVRVTLERIRVWIGNRFGTDLRADEAGSCRVRKPNKYCVQELSPGRRLTSALILVAHVTKEGSSRGRKPPSIS